MSLLQVQGLKKQFGGNLAVDGVSFTLAAGEMLALIGPNGAGKSTVFNMIGGQLSASAGSVLLNGTEILGAPSRKIARLGVARTFQIAAVFSSLTVLENIQISLLAHRRKIYSFWRPVPSMAPERALELLSQVGMREQAHRPCNELAYGDVKRVELAIALACEPRLLLMDEPTAGMAAAERNALIALVQQLVRQHHLAVLFTEHSMDVVFTYADRIIVLARGQVIAQGNADQVRHDPRAQEAYFGTGRTFERSNDEVRS
ncbi:ABC transporter ATP-binding protein [Alcaligenaceae bacterium CGII-47]|nr:ABC transporter ATP-binding protein [Alcaligenaceae bacterium CGII-47]